MNDFSLIIHLSTTIVAISGAVIAVLRVVQKSRAEHVAHVDEKEKLTKKILKEAQEDSELLKTQLEAKIEAANVRISTLELKTEKEFEHVRDVYNNEIKALGEKIQNLRDELRVQHVDIVNLIYKLIDKK